MSALFRSVNPATEEVLEEFETMSVSEGLAVADAARTAFTAWRDVSFGERSRLLKGVARLLLEKRDELARTITLEMGKPIIEAEQEIEKCAFGCEFFSDHAQSFLADKPAPSDSPNSKIVFEPLGTILAIMPWNFPFWQVFRFGAPAIMAGNSMLLKHAPNVPRCARAIQSLFEEAGFPSGILSSIFIDVETVESLIAHPSVRAVTLTGSDRAGSQVSALAGKYLKKSVMELGGSDPFIVLKDASIDAAIDFGIKSRFQNAGQSCIAAKRFIIESPIASEFEDRFVQAVSALTVGNPIDRDTKIGPLARADLRDNLHRQMQESVTMGARLLIGGRPVDGNGFFYEPTVLTNVNRDMPVARQEVFGPVAVFFEADDADHAVAIANDSEFGLGGNVWTTDVDRGLEIARRLYTGGVFVNGMTHSDPRIPFGGVGRSGWGRELSEFGIREFVNVKTLWVGG